MDSPEGVITQFGKPLFAARNNNMLQLLDTLKHSPMVEEAYPFGEYHHVVLKAGVDVETLRASLPASGSQTELFTVKPDIEDCFMALMKN